MDLLVKFDHFLFFLINSGFSSEAIDEIAQGLSRLGEWGIAIIAFAFLAETGRRIFLRHFLVIFVSLFCMMMVITISKQTIDRDRPAKVFEEGIENGTVKVRMFGTKLDHGSFPSGHSAAAFFFMTYIAMFKHVYRFPVFTLAFLIAYSRIYVGVHFPLDCMVGSLIGFLSGVLAWKAFEKVDKRFEKTA